MLPRTWEVLVAGNTEGPLTGHRLLPKCRWRNESGTRACVPMTESVGLRDGRERTWDKSIVDMVLRTWKAA